MGSGLCKGYFKIKKKTKREKYKEKEIEGGLKKA